LELDYEVGLLKTFKEDGSFFVVWNHAIPNNKHEIIGAYSDKKGTIKRIRRDSVYGKKILELCQEEPIMEQSESQKKLAKLISSIGMKI